MKVTVILSENGEDLVHQVDIKTGLSLWTVWTCILGALGNMGWKPKL